MASRFKWGIPALLALAVTAGYFWPAPRLSFEVIYQDVDPAQAASLQTYRQAQPERMLQVEGLTWIYRVVG
ncbi:MAG TPA: hypothetical protein PK954_14530, partial [Anaerolineales bacterium]|nr:hypothetical protein [Anaerolineales bacterium]